MSEGILVENLYKSYSRRVVLRGVSLRVRYGEIYGLLGPNGAGKTTTLKSIVGLVQPDSGRIEVCGYDVKSQRLQALSCVGYVPELAVGFDYLTLKEFLEFVASLRGVPWESVKGNVHRLSERFRLEEHMDAFMGRLSRGTVQKVLVVSALMFKPRVLVLDEPTSGMDPESQRVFREEVASLASGGTAVLISSHLLDTVEKLCSRVGILHKGSVIAEGSLKEVKRTASGGGNATLEEVFLTLTRGE